MTVGAETEEELEKKEAPPQEDDEDEEGDEPSVTPGEGELISFDPLLFSLGFASRRSKEKEEKEKAKEEESDPI